MRYEPSANECADIESMEDADLLDYFITRAAEAEEVWGLGDDSGWLMRAQGEQAALPVWPYREFAHACAVGEWETQVTKAVSLEHFLSKILRLLVDQDLQVEIMPTRSRQGQRVHPERLFKLFESVIDAGEYTLEG